MPPSVGFCLFVLFFFGSQFHPVIRACHVPQKLALRDFACELLHRMQTGTAEDVKSRGVEAVKL